MKILCVCGLGMGSSLILKMTADKALSELGVKDFEIEHWAAGTIGGMQTDLIIASKEFEEEFAERDDVVFVKNIVNVAEVKEKLSEYLTKKNFI
ncbi:MAG: PTS sugar transporter subunit IIB [Oscillospiraceae bacterium]